MNFQSRTKLLESYPKCSRLIRKYIGSNELINGLQRWCLWIDDENLKEAMSYPEINDRVKKVEEFRSSAGTRARTAIGRPHKFAWINRPKHKQVVVPTIFSERREFITAVLADTEVIVSNAASIVHDPDMDIFAILSSKMHMVWVRAVAGKLEERIRYTSGSCYNTFPLPALTNQNKLDLARCGENILLIREAHFPATIADIYDPENMPDDLRRVHEENDDVLERIYIGRRFRNDTERLEKLFDLYTRMTVTPPPATKRARKAA